MTNSSRSELEPVLSHQGEPSGVVELLARVRDAAKKGKSAIGEHPGTVVGLAVAGLTAAGMGFAAHEALANPLNVANARPANEATQTTFGEMPSFNAPLNNDVTETSDISAKDKLHAISEEEYEQEISKSRLGAERLGKIEMDDESKLEYPPGTDLTVSYGSTDPRGLFGDAPGDTRILINFPCKSEGSLWYGTHIWNKKKLLVVNCQVPVRRRDGSHRYYWVRYYTLPKYTHRAAKKSSMGPDNDFGLTPVNLKENWSGPVPKGDAPNKVYTTNGVV